MSKTFTSNVFQSTYKDDFKDSDNYHRVLFNSGRAIQARELTQLQTIIQEEIGRFGRNIFQDGSAVNPGGPEVNDNYEFIKLDTSVRTLPDDTSSLLGLEFTHSATSTAVRVLEVVPAVGSDPATLYVQYTNTSGGAVGTNPVRMNSGVDITSGSFTFTVQSTNTIANPAVGRGAQIIAAEGDFFTRGHFVYSKLQSLIISKYTRYPTVIVGFKVTEDIVTVADTNELYDNQGANPNLSSPGADRYRIKLTLTTKDAVAADESFVYYCNVVEGTIVDQVTGADTYNAPNTLVAQRTFDESGDYIAKDFTIDFSDSGDNLLASVSDGTAYINGHRGATNTPTPLIIAKPRTDVTLTNEVSGISYGQFVLCSELKGDIGSLFKTVKLSTSTTNPAASVTGTARVRFVEKSGAQFKVYLFDIKMNSGQSFRNIKTLGTTTANRAIPVFESSKAVIKDATKVNLVYPLPNPRPRAITDVDFEVQRVSATISNSSSSFSMPNLTVTGETYTNTSDWIVINASTGAVQTGATFGSSGTTAMTVSNVASANAIVYHKVNKSQPVVRPKTLTDATKTATLSTDSLTGAKYLDLSKTDVYSIQSIRLTNSGGTNISHQFTIDDGQRAGFYGNGRLVLNGGETQNGTVYCAFKHFVHGNGDYFSVNSYEGKVDYDKIPAFKVGPRTSVNLRDVVDFRSAVNSSNVFTGSSQNEVPANGDIFQGDVTYYVPRSDKIVVTEQGEVKTILGEAGFASQIPATPSNTLGLFELEHNAYGLNDSDVVVNPIKAKGFTMKDISELENRIDKLEEATTLSMLELDTSSLLVLDSAGNSRMKSGFFVDNFVNRAFSDAENSEYRAAIEPTKGLLSCAVFEDNIGLKYDSAASSNTILKGDTIFLNYTHKVAISQPVVSGTENVNPFAVITGEGNLTLSPASDEWFQTAYKPANVINKTAEEQLGDLNEGNLAVGTAQKRGFAGGGGAWQWSGAPFIPLLGFGDFGIGNEMGQGGTGFIGNLFGGWRGAGQWNWAGLDTQRSSNGINRTGVSTTREAGNGFTSRTSSFSQQVVVGNRTVRKVVGDKTVSLTFLPFIRSREISFRAEGLRPNSRYFPFFDGKDVATFCKEKAFQRHASGTFLSGKENRLATTHPEGSSNLISNSNGEIAGSFFIPSSETTRFRAGTREFKLLDISKNDDAAALSHASNNYVAQGTLDTRQKTVTSTRITQVRTRRWTETTRVQNRDPLAQSFTVNKPSGMFVTKVQTYFKSKDASIPVELQIRPMVNGAPSSTEIIGNASKFLNPSAVNIPSSQTLAAVLNAPTTFEFDEPIFLNPEQDYCIVLLAESIDYNAYVAETYAFELGSTEKRISRQPSMGSLFKSQNGKTWEPDQTKDLAFKIFTADFDTAGGYAVFENAALEKEAVSSNPFFTTTSDATVTMLFPNHGYDVSDTITISGAVGGNGLSAGNINGNRVVTHADGFGIKFEAGSTANAGGRIGGSAVKADRQVLFDTVVPEFTTLQPDDTNITYNVKFTTGKSFASVGQTRYQKDGAYSSEIRIGDENYFPTPRLIAKSVNEASQITGGAKSTTFKVNMTTVRGDVSPLVDAQRVSLKTSNNIIDNQASSAAAGFNVPLSYVAETASFGGSSLAKHMTTVGQLEEPAVGLKLIISCLRPVGSNFDLYWRVAQDGENIFDLDWTLETPEQTIAADERNFRDYRFLIGGDGGDVDAFSQYQFKIVMRTNNSAKVPFFKDLRAIAMAT